VAGGKVALGGLLIFFKGSLGEFQEGLVVLFERFGRERLEFIREALMRGALGVQLGGELSINAGDSKTLSPKSLDLGQKPGVLVLAKAKPLHYCGGTAPEVNPDENTRKSRPQCKNGKIHVKIGYKRVVRNLVRALPLTDRQGRSKQADAIVFPNDRNRARCNDLNMLTETNPVATISNEKLSVLVVDDEYGPRESIAFTLAAEFNVDTAGRASEALAKIRQNAYAAIVLDIRMPEMDGIRALEELRRIDPDVSVIMLTGYGTLLTAQQAMVAGASQYLRKPPDIVELLEAVRKQTQATRLKRHQANLNRETLQMNSALKQEIESNEPQIWQARASVELVHDLNNPLTVVIGYATLMIEEARAVSRIDPDRGQKLLDYASMVERAAEYCHHLSENWRQTSKKTAEYAPIDLVQVVRDVRQVIFFGNAAVQLSGLTTARIRGSKFELMRVFQNLLKNSLEAGSKRVDVSFTRNGANVEMAITDNGAGMGPDLVKRALRGGFSSKQSGTGLGLSICRHLLGAHGATFDLTSVAGKGTVVKSVFPAVVE
jgi:signal transduction histidine kinase